MLEIICYHCQQCGEKAIKAVILSKNLGFGIAKSHDLAFLLNQIKNIVRIDDKYFDYAQILTPYGTIVRYPNEIYLDEVITGRAIKYAEEILK